MKNQHKIKKYILTILCSLLTVLFFASCSLLKYNKVDFITADTVKFQGVKNLTTNSYFYDEKGNNEYLIHYEGINKKIIVFDFKNGDKLKEIQLKNSINSYYVHNLDSIFISNNDEFSEKNNTITLLNKNGQIINKYELNQLLQIPKINSETNKLHTSDKVQMALSDNPYSFFNFYFSDNALFLQVVPQVETKEKYLYPTIAVVTLSNDSIKNISFLGEYPEFYKSQSVFDAAYTSFFVKSDKQIFNSFILSDFVTEYKLKSMTDTLDFTTTNINMLSKNKGGFYPITKHYTGQIATYYGFKYASFRYDKYRNLYYRTAIHALKNEVVNEVVGAKKQNWSIIVTDDKFNIIDEVFCSQDLSYYHDFLITKSGIAFIEIADVYLNNGMIVLRNKVNLSRK